MKERVESFLSHAGSFRDAILVGGGEFYFLGYIVWAINAYRNDLGLLPALDFQYFVAGIPVVVAFCGLIGVAVAYRKVRSAIRKWIGESPHGAKLLLSWVMVWLGVGGISYIVLFPASFGTTPSGAVVLIFVIFIAPMFFPPPAKEYLVPSENKTFSDFVKGFLSWIAEMIQFISRPQGSVFLFGLAVVSFVYVLELYPRIPQEFGGAQPRSVVLDLAGSELSRETLKEIIPDTNEINGKIVRSPKVEVLFSGSDFVIVRTGNGQVHAITKVAVKAMVPAIAIDTIRSSSMRNVK